MRRIAECPGGQDRVTLDLQSRGGKPGQIRTVAAGDVEAQRHMGRVRELRAEQCEPLVRLSPGRRRRHSRKLPHQNAGFAGLRTAG